MLQDLETGVSSSLLFSGEIWGRLVHFQQPECLITSNTNIDLCHTIQCRQYDGDPNNTPRFCYGYQEDSFNFTLPIINGEKLQNEYHRGRHTPYGVGCGSSYYYDQGNFWKLCTCLRWVKPPCRHHIPDFIKHTTVVIPLCIGNISTTAPTIITLGVQIPLLTDAPTFALKYLQFPTIYLDHSIFAFPKDPQLAVITRNGSHYAINLPNCYRHTQNYFCPWGAVGLTPLNTTVQTLFTRVSPQRAYLLAPDINTICVATMDQGYEYGNVSCNANINNYCLNISETFCIAEMCVSPVSSIYY
nr:PREDICTED: uncharacterized protein LOC106705333 [Latimeria chalumnae]|eukprot:XP_014349984.1 PREDICTED: uncharacterized protein LOC106705333 [Latimeria chalumnae]